MYCISQRLFLACCFPLVSTLSNKRCAGIDYRACLYIELREIVYDLYWSKDPILCMN